MTRPSETLAAEAAEFDARVLELAWAGDSASLREVLDGSPDEAVLQAMERAGRLVRLAEAIAVAGAGVIAARSARGIEEPLAQRLGERSAPAAVAAVARVPVGRAADWCRVGQDLAPRRSLTGDQLPALHPVLSAAVDSGALDLTAARTTLETLATIAPQVDGATLESLEEQLVGEAVGMPAAWYSRLCRDVIDRFDPDGVEPREEELREKSGVTVIKRRNGLTRYVIDAHPEASGFITTAIDARTAPRREVRFSEEGEDPGDEAMEDTRTLAQKRLDAIVGICQDALKRDDGDMSGTAVTMLVTIDYETLRSEVGAAHIFGVDEPISAATARRLACSAKILPIVLDGQSQPLELGAGKRLYTEAQRYALAVRDWGCTWPGCPEPPGRCEAAHISPWIRTRSTDLRNGILLCPYHHRRFDRDGWGLRFLDNVPHFIPPPWIDPTQTPRRGGRPRTLTP